MREIFMGFFFPFSFSSFLSLSTQHQKKMGAFFLGKCFSLSLSSFSSMSWFLTYTRQYITPLNQREEQQFFLMIPIWTIGICVRWKHHKQYDSTEPQPISIKTGNHLPFVLYLLSMPGVTLPSCSAGEWFLYWKRWEGISSLRLGWPQM